MTTIQVRTSAETKKKAQAILANLGLDMSTAINMYLVQIVQKGGIPFQILTENGMTVEAEQKILAEVEDAKKNGTVYSSAEAMMNDILSESDDV